MKIEIKKNVGGGFFAFIFGLNWEWWLFDKGTQSGGYASTKKAAERKARKLIATRKLYKSSHDNRIIIEVGE